MPTEYREAPPEVVDRVRALFKEVVEQFGPISMLFGTPKSDWYQEWREGLLEIMGLYDITTHDETTVCIYQIDRDNEEPYAVYLNFGPEIITLWDHLKKSV